MDTFTKEEAEAKVGKRVQLKVHLPSMPAGTRGEVVMFDDLSYTVGIAWDVNDSRSRPVFWFTKDQYDRLLEEEIS
jgi:hypothetical protein